MKKRLIFLSFAALAAAIMSCEKSSDTTFDLAVDAVDIKLDNVSGSTKVNVWSTKQWKARFKDPVDWASLDRLEGEGNAAITFSWSQNVDIERQVQLIFDVPGKSDTVLFTQKGAFEPSMSFTGSKTVDASVTSVGLGFKTNLVNHLDAIESEVSYIKYLLDDEDDEDVPAPEGGWVTNVTVNEDTVTATLAPNTGNRPRKARITLKFTKLNGSITTTYGEITQMNP